MLANMRRFLTALALAGGLPPPGMNAQASPYLPLDDPRLPLLEHLIARGDVEDPSPIIHSIAGHLEGRTVDRFEGLLQATLGLSRRGVLQ